MTENEETVDFKSKMKEIGKLVNKAKKALEEVSTVSKLEIGKSFSNLEKDETKLKMYRKKMEDWEKEGYEISRLKTAIATGVPELVEKVFKTYEKDVEKLKEVESSIDKLNTKGFKRREEEIKKSLKNPDKAILTLKHFIELEIDVRRRMEMDI